MRPTARWKREEGGEADAHHVVVVAVMVGAPRVPPTEGGGGGGMRSGACTFHELTFDGPSTPAPRRRRLMTDHGGDDREVHIIAPLKDQPTGKFIAHDQVGPGSLVAGETCGQRGGGWEDCTGALFMGLRGNRSNGATAAGAARGALADRALRVPRSRHETVLGAARGRRDQVLSNRREMMNM